MFILVSTQWAIARKATTATRDLSYLFAKESDENLNSSSDNTSLFT